MNLISTRMHGIMDYLLGILIIASPWVLNFAAGGAETWVPVVIGALILAQTAMTDFEPGLVHIIPMRTHLIMDIFIGAALACSPWLFSFNERVWMPHVILGIVPILMYLVTNKEPGYSPRNVHRTPHHGV
jgi:hypothetical protein